MSDSVTMPFQGTSMGNMSSITSISPLPTSTVLTLPFYGLPVSTLHGAIRNASSGTTTIGLDCPPASLNSGNAACGLYPTQRLVLSQSGYSYNMDFVDGTTAGVLQLCAPADATTAMCMNLQEDGGRTRVTYTTTGADSTRIKVLPVTITAGADLLVDGDDVYVPEATTPLPPGVRPPTTSTAVVASILPGLLPFVAVVVGGLAFLL